jgi:hypothetical protein
MARFVKENILELLPTPKIEISPSKLGSLRMYFPFISRIRDYIADSFGVFRYYD